MEYQTGLLRFVVGKFGNTHDAEDIVQDAFHNFLRSESPEKLENPKAYLYQTVHNLALNRIRKQKHHDGYINSQETVEETRSPERSMLAHKDLEAVQHALTKLPPQYKRAFVLSRVHSKTYAEISQELDVSVSAVEKYMIKALDFLRKNLDR